MTGKPFRVAWCDAVAQDATLTTTQKALAWRLATYTNSDGSNAWPAAATLARDCGLKNRETVSRNLRVLATAGYVRITEARGGERGNPTNIHQLTLPGPRDSGVTWSQPGAAGETTDWADHVTVESGPRDSGVGDHVTLESHNQSIDQPQDQNYSPALRARDDVGQVSPPGSAADAEGGEERQDEGEGLTLDEARKLLATVKSPRITAIAQAVVDRAEGRPEQPAAASRPGA